MITKPLIFEDFDCLKLAIKNTETKLSSEIVAMPYEAISFVIIKSFKTNWDRIFIKYSTNNTGNKIDNS